jgi:hypothetical protein
MGHNLDVPGILEQVRENRSRLDKCPGPLHEFVMTDRRRLLSRYTCKLCKGEINHEALRWYLAGIEHAIRKGTT